MCKIGEDVSFYSLYSIDYTNIVYIQLGRFEGYHQRCSRKYTKSSKWIRTIINLRKSLIIHVYPYLNDSFNPIFKKKRTFKTDFMVKFFSPNLKIWIRNQGLLIVLMLCRDFGRSMIHPDLMIRVRRTFVEGLTITD